MDAFDRLINGDEVPAEDLIPKPTLNETLEAGGEVDAADVLAPENEEE